MLLAANAPLYCVCVYTPRSHIKPLWDFFNVIPTWKINAGALLKETERLVSTAAVQCQGGVGLVQMSELQRL